MQPYAICRLQIASLRKKIPFKSNSPLTLFRMGLFGAAHGWGVKRLPLSKICHTYPKIMKLGTVIPYLKKTQKIYESHNTSLEFCLHQHFSIKNQQFLLYQKIQIQTALWYIILLTFFESLKIFLTNMVTILMMSAKLATPSLLKIEIFQNKGYDVIILDYDITNKILLHE